MKTVPEALTDLAKLYEDRNKMYGNNYKMFGRSMGGYFPNGLTIKTEKDWNRFGVLFHIATKLSRYAMMFDKGGHPDSLDDISVYAQMLKELDDEIDRLPKVYSGWAKGGPKDGMYITYSGLTFPIEQSLMEDEPGEYRWDGEFGWQWYKFNTGICIGGPKHGEMISAIERAINIPVYNEKNNNFGAGQYLFFEDSEGNRWQWNS